MKRFYKIFTLPIFTTLLIIFPCTQIRIEDINDNIAIARTMDFPINTKPRLTLIKSGTPFNSISPNGDLNFSTNLRYSQVDVMCFGNSNLACQGVNEKGLHISALWLPLYTKFTDIAIAILNKNIAMEVNDFIPYVLGTFSTVDDLKQFLKPQNIMIWADATKAINNAIPTAHFIVTDANGDGIIIEYINGNMVVNDDKFGVLTNSPEYNWHVENVSNYLSIANQDTINSTILGNTLSQNGHGNCFYGIPGDFTPSSRFIKSVFLKNFSWQGQGNRGVIADSQLLAVLASRLIAGLEIPLGEIQVDGAQNDFTQWSTITKITENLSSEVNDCMKIYIKTNSKMNFTEVDIDPIFAMNQYDISFDDLVSSSL